MTIYILIFGCLFFFSILRERFKNNTVNTVLVITLLVICILITGTRYHMGGTDIINYESFYRDTPKIYNLNIFQLIQNQALIGGDIGYTLINAFSKTIGLSFYGFTLLVAIFFYSAMYSAFKQYSSNFYFFLCMFFYKGLLDLTFVYMRQSIAVAIFFLSLKFLNEKKLIRYGIICLIAATVHFSAFFLLALIPIKLFKLTRKFIIIYSICLSFTYIFVLLDINVFSYLTFLHSIFQGVASSKVDSVMGLNNLYANTSTSFLHLAEFLVIDILLIVNKNNLDDLESKEDTIIKMFLLLLPIFSIFANQEILIRLKYYFILVYPVIILYSIKSFSEKIRVLVIIIACVISFLGMYKFAVQFDGGVLSNYHSFLEYGQSIFMKE